MTFNVHRVCMQKFIIEHLSSVTAVYDSQISQKREIEYEARREKDRLWGSRPGQTQTKLSSHRKW